VRIRAASVHDTRRLAELRWDFRTADAPAATSHEAFLVRCEAWMRGALGPHGRWQAWVAERDGVTVGNIWLQLIEKIPNPVVEPESHAYLSNLYVVPEARGGVGQALLDAALAHCHAVHAHSVILWPTEGSRTLYARAGFAPSRGILARSEPRSP